MACKRSTVRSRLAPPKLKHSGYPSWGYSSVGRASALQAEGLRFDPVYLHHSKTLKGLFLSQSCCIYQNCQVLPNFPVLISFTYNLQISVCKRDFFQYFLKKFTYIHTCMYV